MLEIHHYDVVHQSSEVCNKAEELIGVPTEKWTVSFMQPEYNLNMFQRGWFIIFAFFLPNHSSVSYPYALDGS